MVASLPCRNHDWIRTDVNSFIHSFVYLILLHSYATFCYNTYFIMGSLEPDMWLYLLGPHTWLYLAYGWWLYLVTQDAHSSAEHGRQYPCTTTAELPDYLDQQIHPDPRKTDTGTCIHSQQVLSLWSFPMFQVQVFLTNTFLQSPQYDSRRGTRGPRRQVFRTHGGRFPIRWLLLHVFVHMGHLQYVFMTKETIAQDVF